MKPSINIDGFHFNWSIVFREVFLSNEKSMLLTLGFIDFKL